MLSNQGKPLTVRYILSEQGQFFAKNGGDYRYRDGKSFLPVAEYNPQ